MDKRFCLPGSLRNYMFSAMMERQNVNSGKEQGVLQDVWSNTAGNTKED